MAFARIKEYELDDIYNLPDGERAELIDGNIYYMAPPSRVHQKISNSLSFQINQFIHNRHGECEVYSAPFAVFLNDSDAKYVEPDISVICDKDKLTDNGCVGAPDWIIEIVSPSSRQMDYYRKLFKYKSAGVKEYWIVDHEKSVVSVYDFQNDKWEQYNLPNEIPVALYGGELVLNIS